MTSSGLLDLLLTTGSVVSDVQGTRGGRAHWNSEHSLWAETRKRRQTLLVSAGW